MTIGPIRDNCRHDDGRKKQWLQAGARHVSMTNGPIRDNCRDGDVGIKQWLQTVAQSCRVAYTMKGSLLTSLNQSIRGTLVAPMRFTNSMPAGRLAQSLSVCIQSVIVTVTVTDTVTDTVAVCHCYCYCCCYCYSVTSCVRNTRGQPGYI